MTQLGTRNWELGTFLPRLLLAALLAFGSEVLAWTNPVAHTQLDWLLRIPAYLILSAFLLDLIARYRVRDLFGVLVLAGIYALLYALVINPVYAFSDIPRTLVTRVMGAQALIAAEMIGLFLALAGGANRRAGRRLLVGSVVVGLAWGLWVRWWPEAEGYPLVSSLTMLAYGVAGLGLIGAALFLAARRSQDVVPNHLRLSRVQWGIAFLGLLALLVIQVFRGGVDGGGVFLSALILALCGVIVWFRGRAKGETLLDGRIPVQPAPVSTLIPALILFFAAAIATYNLPFIQVGAVTSLTFIGLGFTAYGLAWLPTISLVLGARSYLRQASQRQL
jgi:hypothetical protein